MKLPDEARDIVKILEKFDPPRQKDILITLLMSYFHYEEIPKKDVRRFLDEALDTYKRTREQ